MKEDFSFDSIYHIGTLCTISRVRDSKGMLKIRLVGNERVGLVTFNEPANEGACYGCEYTLVPSFSSSDRRTRWPGPRGNTARRKWGRSSGSGSLPPPWAHGADSPDPPLRSSDRTV